MFAYSFAKGKRLLPLFNFCSCILKESKLGEIHQDTDTLWVYFICKDKDGDVKYLINDEDTSEYWNTDFDTYDTVEEAFQGNVTVDAEASYDEDAGATVFTAYAPILDEDNVVLGLLCIDSEVEK